MVPEPLFSTTEQAVHQNSSCQNANHELQIPTPSDNYLQNSSAWVGPGPAISRLNGGEAHSFSTEMAVPRSLDSEMVLSDAHNQACSDSGLPSPDMILDSGATASHIPHIHQIDNCIDEEMDYEQSPERDVPPRMQVPTLQEPSSPPRESNSSPAWKGHTRSRHTVNSWTWQPGMKRSFSLGYCADCEKCRLKVPGHLNHIVLP
ncbi:hypothetical protein TD95_001078 [Thielaviopsis punctulata]|uniref:Uncharacterized protein n=1 Tax=Thielaviopsis punctulata TaxID=72032 RepID=A0A0F4Z9D7_9PEZI|nr:hypothetical protein TD95_001078 [Thielaviopsis punctulata]